jgi:hypothetical protein
MHVSDLLDILALKRPQLGKVQHHLAQEVIVLARLVRAGQMMEVDSEVRKVSKEEEEMDAWQSCTTGHSHTRTRARMQSYTICLFKFTQPTALRSSP